MKHLFILALSVLFFSETHAQPKRKTSKLIVVTFDGYRWKELYRGADSAKLFSAAYTSQKDSIKKAKYWGANVTERRNKLMPFFWETIATKGQLYGNRDLGNFVNTKNPY